MLEEAKFEEILKEVNKELFKASDTVLNEEMISIYAVEEILRNAFWDVVKHEDN